MFLNNKLFFLCVLCVLCGAKDFNELIGLVTFSIFVLLNDVN